MKKVLLIAFLIIFSLAIAPFRNYALEETGEELKLYMGEVRTISVNNPSRIVIGNPEIADVTDVNKEVVTIIPKSAGTTILVLWDNFGEQAYRIKVFAEDVGEIKSRIDHLLERLDLPEVYTQTEEEEGKVLLLGRVKNAQDKDRINIVLGPLKDKTVDLIVVKEEEAIVEIEVQLLELSKDAETALGFTWPHRVTITDTPPGGSWGGLFRILNATRGATSLTIDALAAEGKARILSRPRVACQSGKEAVLSVGGEKPIFTTQVAATTGAAGTNVEYKEYGIKLKIKPTVTEEKSVKLALNVEVSEIGAAESIGSTGGTANVTSTTARAYPLTKRNVSTELYLSDGQTLAIGGLIKQKSEEDIGKVPGLGDVPILGLLFRKKATKTGGGTGERGDTELFITLTPHIIGTKKEMVEAKKEIKPKITTPVLTEAPSTPLTEYAKVIQRRILENLTYPAAAKDAGFQGTVKLRLHLSYQGKLLEALIKESSGYKLLDDNAISVAQKVTAYPPFSPSISQKELWIEIPIVYQLD